MKKVIFALFKTWQQAYNGVEALNHIGYTNEMMRVIARTEILAHRDSGGNIIGSLAHTMPFTERVPQGFFDPLKKWFGQYRHATEVAEELQQNHLLVAVETGDMGADIVGRTLHDHGAYELHIHDPHHEKVALA